MGWAEDGGHCRAVVNAVTIRRVMYNTRRFLNSEQTVNLS